MFKADIVNRMEACGAMATFVQRVLNGERKLQEAVCRVVLM